VASCSLATRSARNFWSGARTLFGPLGALSAGDANRVTHSYADLLCLLAELFGVTL